jgi:hypothetical protein
MEFEADISDNGRIILLSLVPSHLDGIFRVSSEAYGTLNTRRIGIFGIKDEDKRLITGGRPDLIHQYVQLDTTAEGVVDTFNLDNCHGSVVIADGVEAGVTSFIETAADPDA